MSTLVVDTLTGLSTATTITVGSTPVVSASANSLTIRGEGSAQTSIQQGLVKASGHFEGSDASLDDSFNTASLTDNATGKYSPQFTSNMGNTNYSAATNCTGSSNTASNSGSKAQTYAAGSFQIVITENGADSDENDTIYIVVGDLA